MITLSPVNTTVALGTNATFSCQAENNILWEVANTQIRDRSEADRYRDQYKIYVPLPMHNFSEVIITATNVTNSTSIICVVEPSNGVGNPVTKSEEVKILAYGEFSNEYSSYLTIQNKLFVCTSLT